MNRQEILEKAEKCVCGERDLDYGTPENNFSCIAEMWSTYLGCPITAEDVSAMMILLKVARIVGGSKSIDNWVDIAGYAACGGEVSRHE